MSQKRQTQQALTYHPPADQEAEQSVLGAILVRPSTLDAVADLLTPGDFYREAHGRIFQAMLDLYGKNEPVDLVTVCALLRNRKQIEGVGGDVFLAGLSEQVGFATNAPLTRPTRTAPIGPAKGMSDTASAADAPLIERMSGSFCPSALSRSVMIWVS